MDCSLTGSSVHGISQARILEWVDISFSRGSSQLRNQICISCVGRQVQTVSHQGSLHWGLQLQHTDVWGHTVQSRVS